MDLRVFFLSFFSLDGSASCDAVNDACRDMNFLCFALNLITLSLLILSFAPGTWDKRSVSFRAYFIFLLFHLLFRPVLNTHLVMVGRYMLGSVLGLGTAVMHGLVLCQEERGGSGKFLSETELETSECSPSRSLPQSQADTDVLLFFV